MTYQNLEQGALGDKLGITITHIDDTTMEVTMPVEGNTQIYGILHGGANGVLVEHVASGLAVSQCPEGKVPVGTDLHVTHVAPATGGEVRARGSIVRRTNGSIWVRVDIFQGEQLTAFGSLSLRYITPRKN